MSKCQMAMLQKKPQYLFTVVHFSVPHQLQLSHFTDCILVIDCLKKSPGMAPILSPTLAGQVIFENITDRETVYQVVNSSSMFNSFTNSTISSVASSLVVNAYHLVPMKASSVHPPPTSLSRTGQFQKDALKASSFSHPEVIASASNITTMAKPELSQA